VTFSPNGVVHQIALSFNDTNADNAILASRSTTGGATWSEPACGVRKLGSLGGIIPICWRNGVLAAPDG
jgi:hypothetical protein